MIDTHQFSTEFRERYGSEPLVVSAPGRVNLIGEHTDYNDGFVLPFAIDRRTFVGISPRTDDVVRAYTRSLDKSTEFSLGERTDTKDWSMYLRGIASVLREKGVKVPGADILIDSDVPFGAGLSSSAALEIALGLAFTTASGTQLDGRDLAFAGQRVEHEFAGVRSGIMDQFASALGKQGCALLIDCRSFEVRPVPLLMEVACLVICNSGVKHSLASSEYNRRREECEEGVSILSRAMPGINSLRDVELSDLENHSNEIPETILKRCRHVVTENARTLSAAAAFESGDLATAGELMVASHRSLQHDYEVSAPELDLLVDTAMEIDGVVGSRMTGGGFGGCTISLLQKTAYPAFEQKITEAYTSGFGLLPEISIVVPSEGARRERP